MKLKEIMEFLECSVSKNFNLDRKDLSIPKTQIRVIRKIAMILQELLGSLILSRQALT